MALVKLRDYLAFLTDERGDLRRHIFDWNVRDYQGDVEVNREIRDTLQEPAAPEFWWLNNGVTIVCSRASSVSKTYSLDNVQVVNGLQTSHTIFGVLRGAGDDHPALESSVLVRILVTGDDPKTRDRVIRATNRQTSVPAASLRATDDIQRDIEAFFLGTGWFYDRRKNFYRNNGKSPERIISIPLLAQAVMAMGLSRPDDSRARPSSLLKRDEDYTKIFSPDIPIKIYLWLAQSQKAVDGFLLSETAMATPPERTNLRFHLAMVAATRLVGSRVHSPRQLRPIVDADTPITAADLTACLGLVRTSFGDFGTETGDTADKIAKGSEFIDYLLARALADLDTDTTPDPHNVAPAAQHPSAVALSSEATKILAAFSKRELHAGEIIEWTDFGDTVVWKDGYIRDASVRDGLQQLLDGGLVVESAAALELTPAGEDLIYGVN